MANIINVASLSKSYGRKNVLNDISFQIEEGSIVGLLGPNGCGKTTLIKILTGLIHDYEGTVLIDGKAPGIYTKSVTAYLPERTFLPEWMKAKDAIDYFQDFFADFDKVKAMDMLSRFRVGSVKVSRVNSFGIADAVTLYHVSRIGDGADEGLAVDGHVFGFNHTIAS